MTKKTVLLLSGLTFGILGACGGGGGSSSSSGGSVVTPPVSSVPTYTKGVFAPESTFAGRCKSPRSGTSDKAGSITHENFWIRSWSNDKYLWYSEIPDTDPSSISTTEAYFDTQKTSATTASGAPKDRFHYIIPTDEYQQQVSSGSSAGYGARFSILKSSPPRSVVIAYTEAGSPAEAASARLKRGTEILEVDGVDVVDGSSQSDVNTINAAIFPSKAGETHTFVVQDVGSDTKRTITMTSAVVSSVPVRETRIIEHENGKIGYMLFNTFGTSLAEKGLFDAMNDFSEEGVKELVVDLRYNGGGFLTIASELGYMIAGEANTNGRTFEKLTFNSKHPTKDPVTGETLTPAPFYSEAKGFSVASGTDLPSLNLDRVFILSTARTCSASESLINSLEGINVDVVLIGTTTCGKPYGFYSQDNCGNTYFSIQFKGVNDKGFGDYSDGFTPGDGDGSYGTPIKGCLVADDYSKPLGDVEEDLFETALSYIDNGVCSPPDSASARSKMAFHNIEKPGQSDDPASLYNSEYLQRRLFLEQNRIINDEAPTLP